ncbi:MAG: hypothetical protein HW405_440 [Candidatus Berkelbacteria bacterium]|nr:hypothetical protein [Candidatus Berkelbacteria bacterium]
MPAPESSHKISPQEIKGLEKHYLLPRVSHETSEIVEGLVDRGKLGQEYQHVFAEENEVLFEHMNFLLGKIAEVQKSTIPYDSSDPWLPGYRESDPLYIARNICFLLEDHGSKKGVKEILPRISFETIADTKESLKRDPEAFDKRSDIVRQDNPHLFDLLNKMADRYGDESNIARINFEIGQLAYYILRTQAEKERLNQEL